MRRRLDLDVPRRYGGVPPKPGAVEHELRPSEGDLRMLCYFRGRDRTLDQLGALAKSACIQCPSHCAILQTNTVVGGSDRDRHLYGETHDRKDDTPRP